MPKGIPGRPGYSPELGLIKTASSLQNHPYFVCFTDTLGNCTSFIMHMPLDCEIYGYLSNCQVRVSTWTPIRDTVLQDGGPES